MASLSGRVAVPPHVLVRFLDDESVLLNLETERYFGLDDTGTRMWQLLTSLPNIDAVFQQLLAEYEVDPDELRKDLEELLSRLVSNGLLHVAPTDSGTLAAV